MADYYPLIARALEGLSDKSPDMRRAVYERARGALMAQLQSLDPPLPSAELTRERLALDDAIDRLETEYAIQDLLGGPPSSAARQPPEGPPTAPAPARQQGAREPVPQKPPAREPPPREPPARQAPPARGDPYRPATPPPARATDMPARPPPAETEAEAALFGGPVDDAGPAPQKERPRIGTITQTRADGGRKRALVLAGVLLLVVGLIAYTAWHLRVQPAEIEAGPTVEGPKVAEGNNKNTERIGGQPAPGAAPAQPGAPAGAGPRPDVAVAQRAILYEENPADPQNPKASPGRVLWRLDAVNPGQGQPLETVVRANADVASAGLSLVMSIRRNNDAALPASHIVELTFSTTDDPQRIVRDVGLMQFKGEEAVRGTPIAGLPVPVKDNVFLIGLSNLPGDMERNKELMLRRNWIDLPVRFASGQRAILSFEKGVSGDQVMNDAFRMWQ